jgi:hypothetical protein
VCQRFAKRVMQTLRRLALREHGLRSVQSLHSGVLLVVQRFRSDLGLYVHIHALAMDGCFEADCGDEVRFLPLAGLSAAHLVRVLERLHRDDQELAAITKPLRDEQLCDRPPTRLSWMTLLARVFRLAISVCSRCGGPMRIVRADEIAAELHGARAPPRPSPRLAHQPPERVTPDSSPSAPAHDASDSYKFILPRRTVRRLVVRSQAWMG